MDEEKTRRAFLSYVAGGIAAAGCGASVGSEPRTPEASASDRATASSGTTGRPVVTPAADAQPPGVPTRPLGRTGDRVSIIGLGGFHIARPERAAAIRIMHRAIDSGITFFDNCWDYNGGESEDRMGEALADGHRGRVFLMTKIDGRTKKAAAEQIDQSLKRLRTDHVDLLQVHEVIRFEDADSVFREDGAIQALLEAKKAGKLRFIGFTGHKDPAIHLAMLESAKKHGFAYDTVQMPINAMDPHYKSFEENVLPVLKSRGIGVLGMKSLGSGELIKSGVVRAEECLRYSLSVGPDVVITGIDDEKILDQAISVAQHFTPMPESERMALLERTKEAGARGKYEVFKTTDTHDGTARNPKWLTTSQI
jgi:aryl-alcohol dehydrogenase-like predicted oxidoreductase